MPSIRIANEFNAAVEETVEEFKLAFTEEINLT